MSIIVNAEVVLNDLPVDATVAGNSMTAEAEASMLQVGDMIFVKNVAPRTEIALKDTGFATWTPSTSSKVIRTAGTIGTFTALDLSKWDYWIRVYGYFDIVYRDGTTQAKAQLLRVACENWYCITRRPSTLTNLRNGTRDYSTAEAIQNIWVLHYTTSASASTITYGQSYGFFLANSVPTLSSMSVESPTVTVKSPALNARCSTTYFSTAFAAKVDQAKSKFIFKADVYKSKAGYTRKFAYSGMTDTFNNGL